MTRKDKLAIKRVYEKRRKSYKKATTKITQKARDKGTKMGYKKRDKDFHELVRIILRIIFFDLKIAEFHMGDSRKTVGIF